MTEFAELIGTDQSTVSRYESGRILPSKTTLIVLLLLSREEEKAPILAAMGEVDEHALRTRFEGAQETLGALLRRHRQARRSSAVELKRIEFAEESAAIVSSGRPIEPALVEIIKLCRKYSDNRKLRNSLAQMLPYFEFVATQPRATHE